jgi:hypothetical protein
MNEFFFIDFLDELGLFIGEKPIFTKKKIELLCRLARFHGRPKPSCGYATIIL